MFFTIIAWFLLVATFFGWIVAMSGAIKYSMAAFVIDVCLFLLCLHQVGAV